MNARHRRTLEAVYRTPVPASLAFADIEALFVACGARVIEGSGSRVRFILGDVVASFHRPHPERDAKRYQVRDAREFLDKCGIRPSGEER